MSQCSSCPWRKKQPNGEIGDGGISVHSIITFFPLGHGCHDKTESGKNEDWIKETTPKCVGSLSYARSVFI